MKNIKQLILGIIVLFTISACTRIEPGYSGFKLNYSGDYRGTDSLPAITGWNFYMPGFSTVIEYPVSMQHIVWTSDEKEGGNGNQEISIGCKGGAGFLLDVGLNYKVIPNRVAHVYFKFKATDLEDLGQGFIRNSTRNVLNNLAGTYTVDSLLTNRPQFEKLAQQQLYDYLIKDGIEISQLSILSTPRPTDAGLAQSITNKIKAKQDAETSQMQLQQSIAESNKKIATARGDSASKVIMALGQAIANQKMQQSLTPMLLQKMYYDTWDGHLPTYMLGSNTSMLMQIPK